MCETNVEFLHLSISLVMSLQSLNRRAAYVLPLQFTTSVKVRDKTSASQPDRIEGQNVWVIRVRQVTRHSEGPVTACSSQQLSGSILQLSHRGCCAASLHLNGIWIAQLGLTVTADVPLDPEAIHSCVLASFAARHGAILARSNFMAVTEYF